MRPLMLTLSPSHQSRIPVHGMVPSALSMHKGWLNSVMKKTIPRLPLLKLVMRDTAGVRRGDHVFHWENVPPPPTRYRTDLPP